MLIGVDKDLVDETNKYPPIYVNNQIYQDLLRIKNQKKN